jgi:hypothetical protein
MSYSSSVHHITLQLTLAAEGLNRKARIFTMSTYHVCLADPENDEERSEPVEYLSSRH